CKIVELPEETMPLVSIVCASHGRQDMLLRCLNSCLEQNFNSMEIVVVLNPANEDCETAIRKTMPQVMIIRTHRNIGIYPALNLAIANSNGQYVLTLDDDSYFLTPDVISRLVDAFIDEPELGAVTCNLEGPHEKTLVGDDRYVASFKAGFTM